MRPFLWYILAASAAVLGDIVIGVTANLVEVPKGYYAVPIAATLALVLVKAIRSSKYPAPHYPVPRTASPGKMGTDCDILRGVNLLLLAAAIMLAIFTCAFGFAYLTGFEATTVEGGIARNTTAGVIFLACTFVILILLSLLGPSSLVFSSDGISVKSAFRNRHISWDEAADFRVIDLPGPEWLDIFGPQAKIPYLAASPIRRSTSFRQGWGFNDKYNVLLLCNLSNTLIKPHRVKDALDFWNPNP